MNRKPFVYTLTDIGQGLLENLFPKKRSCLFCGRFWYGSRLSAGLCPQCLLQWGRLRQRAKICPLCGSFDNGDPCQGPCAEYRDIQPARMGSLAAITAATPYTAVYRQRVMALKYNGQKKLAAPLAYLMAKAWRESEGLRRDAGLPLHGGSRERPFLVPVPMHREKEAARGYNQSKLLAEAFNHITGFPVKELLIRPHMGQMQASLGKMQRKVALDRVFQWAGAAESPAGPAILIDDVVTTGATLESCGQILKEQGFKPIWGLTFAGGSGLGTKNP